LRNKLTPRLPLASTPLAKRGTFPSGRGVPAGRGVAFPLNREVIRFSESGCGVGNVVS